MRSLKSFILEDNKLCSFKNHLEINEAVESVEASVVDNKPTDILHIENSPLPWQKVGRLTPEKFNDIFGGKLIVICVPCTSISSFADGLFEQDAKSTRRKFSSYIKRGKSIIVVSSITKDTCEVNDIEFAPQELYASWGHMHYSAPQNRKIKTEDVIKSIAALRLKIFQERGGSKLWVINNCKEFGYNSNFGWEELFKPFRSIINNYFDAYNKVFSEVESLVKKGDYIQDVTKLDDDSTWNYAVLNNRYDSDMKVSIVGYKKATIISHAYMNWPVILHPNIVSTSEFYMPNGKGMSGYKITDTMYDDATKIIDKLQIALDTMNNDFENLYNKWISKFMLGEPIEFDSIENEVETNIEDKAKSERDKINKN